MTQNLLNDEINLYYNPQELDDLQLAAKAIEFIQEFYSFIQPLSVDLMVGYRDLNWSLVNDVEPLHPHWYIQSSHAPSYVLLETGITNPHPRFLEVPNLSPQVLLKWIRNALKQEHPSDKYKITWSCISVNSTRLRIFNEHEFKTNKFTLLSSYVNNVDIPLETFENCLWVTGPIKNETYLPPVSFLLSHQYGGLSATIYLYWFKWTEISNAEKVALHSCISRLLNEGWLTYEQTIG